MSKEISNLFHNDLARTIWNNFDYLGKLFKDTKFEKDIVKLYELFNFSNSNCVSNYRSYMNDFKSEITYNQNTIDQIDKVKNILLSIEELSVLTLSFSDKELLFSNTLLKALIQYKNV